MALATQQTAPLTYEAYMAEGETPGRYDIVNGVRIIMANPIPNHQKVLLRTAGLFEEYQDSSGRGQVFIAPRDVLIRKSPLRTRQPDILFISIDRLMLCAPPDDPAPLSVGPEIVVEILSDSDRRGALRGKLDDYRKVSVNECWIVDLDLRTIRVLELAGEERVGTFGSGEYVRSFTYPDLVVAVDEAIRF